MPYPNEVDKFSEKLNKNDALYVIEEVVTPVDGLYKNILAHDNIVDSSVRVYTGSKLTGDRIDNFILSIPADMDWKRIIKIFSTVPAVYVTYESYGDQVESEDINRLQDSMASTQNEVDRYKAANDLVVTNTVNRVTTLENNKAEKTYVDTELLKKSDKVNTYTKTETDSRIQAIVDAAPAALDTLNEIAAALNDDPNFAATMTTELTKKVDKVTGKQLSTEDYSTSEKTKLAGIETEANKYIHPSTHPATVIVEDTTHRFASDTEKTNWNGKLDATANAVSASKLATARTIALSGDVTGSGSFDGSGNLTITTVVGDDTHNHIISNVDGLQTALDSKVDDTEVSTVATASKILKLDANSKLPASITGNADGNAATSSKLQTARTISLVGDLSGSTTFDGSGNVTIAATVADDSHNHVISNIDGLQLALDAKETPSGAQSKVDTHANRTDNPHAVSKAQVSLGNVDDVQQATKEEFNTHNGDNTRHITAAERTIWNAKSNLALGETSVTAYRGDRGKVAYDHSQVAHAPSTAQKNSDITKAEIEAKLTGDITSHAHNQYVTQNQLGIAGYGDMLKSVYDSDGDGIVDAAENVPWTGVTGKPSTFAPNTISVDGLDMNNVKATGFYRGYNMTNGAIKTISSFIVIQYSPDWVVQMQFVISSPTKTYIRSWHSASTWTPWERMLTNKQASTWNDLKGV